MGNRYRRAWRQKECQTFPFKRAPSRFLRERSPASELGRRKFALSECGHDTVHSSFPRYRNPHSNIKMLSICLVISLVTSLITAAPTATEALGNSRGLPRCSVNNVKLVLPPTAVSAGVVVPSNVKPVHVLLGRGVQVNRGHQSGNVYLADDCLRCRTILVPEECMQATWLLPTCLMPLAVRYKLA